MTPAYHWHLGLDDFGWIRSYDTVHERSGRRVLFLQFARSSDAEPFVSVYVHRAKGEEFDPTRLEAFARAHAELADGATTRGGHQGGFVVNVLVLDPCSRRWVAAGTGSEAHRNGPGGDSGPLGARRRRARTRARSTVVASSRSLRHGVWSGRDRADLGSPHGPSIEALAAPVPTWSSTTRPCTRGCSPSWTPWCRKAVATRATTVDATYEAIATVGSALGIEERVDQRIDRNPRDARRTAPRGRRVGRDPLRLARRTRRDHRAHLAGRPARAPGCRERRRGGERSRGLSRAT